MTRDDLLAALHEAGRALSDEAIFFHTALSTRLGLGVTDWKALGLMQAQGPMPAGDLARLTGLTPPSVTAMLRRLEAGGWISRQPDPGDGRRVVVGVNEYALARLGNGFGGLLRRTGAIYDAMSEEELAKALTLLTALAQASAEARRELSEGNNEEAASGLPEVDPPKSSR